MSILKTIFHFGFAAAVGTALLVSGCAKPVAEKDPTPEGTPQVETAELVQKAEPATHALVGVWWGTGALDENALATAIQGLPLETQLQVAVAGESFLATEMAIEFKTDGKMETAVEVTGQLGQRESGSSVATWEAAPTATRGEFRVSSVEAQADGSKVSDYKTYRLSADGRKLILLVDLPDLLGQCSPQIVLDRQDEVQTIANESSGTLR